MRTIEQIEKLKETHSDPQQVKNLLNEKKVNFLLDYYHNSKNVEEKNTGPKVLYVEPGEGIIDDVLENLKSVIGDFKVRSAHFFDVSKPHILHNDDANDLPDAYKAITLPLYIDGTGTPRLVFFDQYYYHGPVKLFKGRRKEIEVHYNKPLIDYSEVSNLSQEQIPDWIRQRLLSHLKDRWLEGLSVHSYFPWTIGSGIIFDSLQIHCASNFLEENVTRKIGLSIFTTK